MNLTWESILKGSSESHLVWSTNAGFLNFEDMPIKFHTIDREILMLSARASASGLDLAILYPVCEFHLLVPMAVEILYNLMNSQESRKSVLLITNRLNAREDYRSLKTNYMHIHEDAFRLCIVKRDGSYRRMRQRSGYRPGGWDRFFITTSERYLPDETTSSEINSAIVDLSGSADIDLEHINEWSRKNGVKCIIYVDTNPYSDYVKYFKKNGIPLWGWNKEELKNECESEMEAIKKFKSKYENPFSVSIFSILNSIQGINKRIVEIKDDELDILMTDAVKLYYSLKAEAEKSEDYSVKNAAYCFLSILFSMQRMTAPLKYVEEEREIAWGCRTIDEMIEALDNFTSMIYKKNELLGSYFSKTKTCCRKLYEMFEKGSGFKPRKIGEIIDEAIKCKKKTLIISYNETYMRALLNFLNDKFGMSEEYLNDSGISFSTLKSALRPDIFEQCVFFGHLPKRYMFLMRASLSRNMVFLAYPAEKSLLEYQMEEDENMSERLFSVKDKIKVLEKIIGKPPEDIEKLVLRIVEKTPSETTKRPVTVESEKEKSAKMSLEPFFKAIRDDEDKVTDAYDEQIDLNIDQSEEDESRQFIDENCINVVFQDNCQMFLRESKMVPVFVDYQNKIVYKKALSLKKNDVIVAINRQEKKDLTTTILEMVDTHPSMNKINVMVKSWVYYLRKGMKSQDDNIDSLLSKLVERGTKITSGGTVYFWEKGYVIGPRNPEDIKRIGEIYNSKFLIQNYKEIYAAIRRLRGIHQSLLRRLSKAIPQAGVMAISAQERSEIVDEELDLHLEDFLDIISLHRIRTTEGGQKVELSKQDRIIEAENHEG